MNVTVAEEDKLRRKLQVEVPLKDVTAAYETVYAQLRSNIRISGFRPGKFPRHLAEKRFKSVMEGEAMQTLVPKYYDEALKELELRPATEPKFDNFEIDQKKPFKFDVEFEVVPEVKLLSPGKFKLTEKKSKVTPKDIDARVEDMRTARATYADKGNKAAAEGDAVTFDFQGTLDGDPFNGGSGEGQRIEVGSGQYLPEFDAAFKGIKAGESKTFPLSFPEDYGEPSLAGKEVEFHVTAHQVEEKILPELDEEFFSQMDDVEDLNGLKEQIKAQLGDENDLNSMKDYQEDLTEQIRKAYAFDVPEILVEGNLEDFEHQLTHSDPEALKDEKKVKKLKDEEGDKIRSNLRIAYVIDALARENDIKAEEEEVRQRFFYQAYMMGQNPQELIKDPMGRRMLMQIEQGLLTTRSLELLAKQVLAKGGTSKSEGTEKEKPASKAAGVKASSDKEKATKDKKPKAAEDKVSAKTTEKPATKEKASPKTTTQGKAESKTKKDDSKPDSKSPTKKPKAAKDKA